MSIAVYFSSLSVLKLLKNMPGGIAQGLIWGLMALGVYITFRLLDVADLTITKSVDSSLDPDQSFIFNVVGDNGISMKVVIKGGGSVTIKNLPIATYTVTEDQTWSWRYEATSGSGTSIKLGAGLNQVTISNNRKNPYWLSGDSYKENWFSSTKD